MKFDLARAPGQNLVTGYGTGYVVINGERHENHLLVTAERVEAWNVAGFESLAIEHVERFMAVKPEIILLGTGPQLRFPPPELARALSEFSVGLEVMDSTAACRTYNILVAEGRRVLAAILLP